MNGVAAILALLLIKTEATTTPLFIFFSIWLVFIFSVAFVPLPKKSTQERMINVKYVGRVFRNILSVMEGWHELRTQPTLLKKLIALTLGAYAINFAINLTEFHLLGLPWSVETMSLYTALTMASVLVALTPGSIGIRESILLVTSGVIGITESEVLQLAVMDRGIMYGTLFILGIVSRTLLRRTTSQITDLAD